MFANDTAFSYETLRAAGYIPYDGGDLGEIMATAAGIEEGDWESWYAQWRALADRTYRIAESAAGRGHRESARCAYLRASNYYRTAEFFLRDDPADDPRLMETWRAGVQCFTAALTAGDLDWRPVTIPYEGIGLQGYYLSTGDDGTPRPTLLAHGGFDSTVEEMYFAAAAAALRRGWNCMIFEGPGQGAALREHGLTFRPDWEAVVTPAIDYALSLPGVDGDRIALLGMSMGGHLAPRAAACDHRVAACVAFDGVHNLAAALGAGITAGRIDVDPVPIVDDLLARRHRLPSQLRWLLSHAQWVFGAPDARTLVETVGAYDLTGTAERITCPTLVCEAQHDHFFPGQPRTLYDALTCRKELVTFTAAEGGDEHCQAGALTLFHQRAFDWLDDVLNGH
jgi:dienelactone hydrolase